MNKKKNREKSFGHNVVLLRAFRAVKCRQMFYYCLKIVTCGGNIELKNRAHGALLLELIWLEPLGLDRIANHIYFQKMSKSYY